MWGQGAAGKLTGLSDVPPCQLHAMTSRKTRLTRLLITDTSKHSLRAHNVVATLSQTEKGRECLQNAQEALRLAHAQREHRT